MKNSIQILVLVIIGLLVQDCNENAVNIDSGPHASPKMDLTIGNKWNYNFIQYDQHGNIFQSWIYYKKILRDTMIADEKYSIISEDTAEASQIISRLAREKSDGYYERLQYKRESGSNLIDTLILTYKYPAMVSSKYIVPSLYDQKVFDTTTIESVYSIITVPAGKFTCYKYITRINFYGKDSLNKLVVVPAGYIETYVSNKGVVKMEAYAPSTNPRLLILYELKSYNLN